MRAAYHLQPSSFVCSLIPQVSRMNVISRNLQTNGLKTLNCTLLLRQEEGLLGQWPSRYNDMGCPVIKGGQ